jgi:hypothetical protein
VSEPVCQVCGAPRDARATPVPLCAWHRERWLRRAWDRGTRGRPIEPIAAWVARRQLPIARPCPGSAPGAFPCGQLGCEDCAERTS